MTMSTLPNGVKMPRIALGTAPLKVRRSQSTMSSTDETTTASEATNDTGNGRGRTVAEGQAELSCFGGFLPEQVARSVAIALEQSLSSNQTLHLDTAFFYRSHTSIGHVVTHYFMTGRLQERSQLFITTKVFHPHNGFGTDSTCMPPNLNDMTPSEVSIVVRRHCQQCLEQLNVGYIDLLILHWPGCWNSSGQDGKSEEQIKAENAARRLAAWKVLEEMYENGWARSIGVSNFSVDHLTELMPSRGNASVAPMVNQIEASVYCQHDEIREFCLANSIVPVAYSPFGNGQQHVSIGKEQLLQELADKHSAGCDSVTPGHIVFAYLLQKGYGGVVFWSTNEDRIRSNLTLEQVPNLSEEEMELLDRLNRQNHDNATWGLLSPNDVP